MASYTNFKNFGEAPLEEGGERPNANPPLARQSSVYSLTLDEFQTTFNGFGKDFGSMNMDELLRNIWTAEETQAMATTSVAREGNNVPYGSLPRQGSLTLPRTLSQKTVDEVWKDLFKGSTTSAIANDGMSNFVQERQPTLGEITLEEFLSRAGVVREDTNPDNNRVFSDLLQPNNSDILVGRPNNNGFLSDLSQPNNSNYGMSVPRPHQNLITTNRFPENGNSSQNQQNMSLPKPHQNLVQPQRPYPQQAALTFASPVPSISNGLVQGGVTQRDSLFEPVKVVPSTGMFQNQLNPENVRKSTVEQIFPKQATVSFASSVPPISYETKSPRVNLMNGTFGQGNFTEKRSLGLTGLENEKTIVKAGSPMNHFSSDRVANRNKDTSVSPLPYMFNEGVRGRRGVAIEKATERRHKRMIKNRESAARSRARKQAYTIELEAEINQLKEVNQRLKKEQEEIIEAQSNKIMEAVNRPWGSKRLSLRRTVTGPW